MVEVRSFRDGYDLHGLWFWRLSCRWRRPTHPRASRFGMDSLADHRSELGRERSPIRSTARRCHSVQRSTLDLLNQGSRAYRTTFVFMEKLELGSPSCITRRVKSVVTRRRRSRRPSCNARSMKCYRLRPPTPQSAAGCWRAYRCGETDAGKHHRARWSARHWHGA